MGGACFWGLRKGGVGEWGRGGLGWVEAVKIVEILEIFFFVSSLDYQVDTDFKSWEGSSSDILKEILIWKTPRG